MSLRMLFSLGLTLLAVPAAAQVDVPPASETPLAVDFAGDPILRLRDSYADPEAFRAEVARAVTSDPVNREAMARRDEAEAVIAEARERLGPSAVITLQSYRVIARDFDTNSLDNLVERTRPLSRTDALVQIDQRLFDFGASVARLRAAEARSRAADSDASRIRSALALAFIAAWYDVVSYRALVEVTDAFLAIEPRMRGSVERRIADGASAPVDLAQLDALFADVAARRARVARALGEAEARYIAQAGITVPSQLERPPPLGAEIIETAQVLSDARANATVRTAEELAQAARDEARAARRDRLPTLSAGIDTGGYGIFEDQRDYDIRARVTLRAPIYGTGLYPRADQAAARARAAEAYADRVRLDAERDAQTAISDMALLARQLEALERSYKAARISRDAVVTRFLSQRGTVADVAAAENAFVARATEYIQGLGELDAARYVMLARTGRLLDRLGIAPYGPELSDEW